MRTNDEIDEASMKIVGLHTCFLPEGAYTCAVVPVNDELSGNFFKTIEYNSEFLALSPDDQDCILYHEKGHLVSMEKSSSANAKIYIRLETPYKYNRWYERAECEADLYVANQLGIDRILKLFSGDKLFHKKDKTERRKRIRNLLKAWREQ